MKIFFTILSILLVLELHAQKKSIITGTLLGCDDKPMIVAHVHLKRPSQMKPLLSFRVTPDGTFKIQLKKTGYYILQFTGVDHQMIETPLLLDKYRKVNFNVRLAHNQYITNYDSIDVICDLLDTSKEDEGFPVRRLEKISDTLYQVEINTNSKKFAYQFSGLDLNGHTFNGTQSEEFNYDDGGDYQSIITPKTGKVIISFEPQKLIHSTAPQEIHFPDSTTSMMYNMYGEMTKKRNAFSQAYGSFFQSGGLSSDFKYDVSSYADSIVRQYRQEKNFLTKQMLIMRYFDLSGRGLKSYDSTIAEEALKIIPPQSPLWSGISIITVLSATKKWEKHTDFIDKMIDHNPDDDLRALLIYNRLSIADYKNDKKKARYNYKTLQSRYPKTRYAKDARRDYDPNKRIQGGRQIPQFTFRSIDDTNLVVSNTSMLGKYYLIDFWSTGCPPCVKEIENIQNMYEKYHEKNFDVISVSSDVLVEIVQTFRKKKFKMPWFNSLVERNTKNVFEISANPRPILVDPRGKIITAERKELMGEELEKTLNKAIGSMNNK